MDALTRLKEVMLGGPSRPFRLTLSEASLLESALECYASEMARFFQSPDALPVESPLDAEADADLLGRTQELRLRVRRFQGFGA